MYGLRNSELSTCLFQFSHKTRQTMLLYAYFTPKVDFERKFNHHQSFLYAWRLTARTIRKCRIGPSIRIESRIGRTIRNRIGSRSFAGPYFVHTQFTSRATKFGRIIHTRQKVSNSEWVEGLQMSHYPWDKVGRWCDRSVYWTVLARFIFGWILTYNFQPKDCQHCQEAHKRLVQQGRSTPMPIGTLIYLARTPESWSFSHTTSVYFSFISHRRLMFLCHCMTDSWHHVYRYGFNFRLYTVSKKMTQLWNGIPR